MIKNLFTKNNKKKKQLKLDNTFLDMCDTMSKLSYCVSHKVATILTINNRILSSGINGTSSGSKNCDQIFNQKQFDRKKHHEFSDLYEIHSEMNAIINAAKNGIAIDGATAYCNLEPCFECSKNLSMSGIKRIVFRKKYDINVALAKQRKKRNKYLKEARVSLEHVKR